MIKNEIDVNSSNIIKRIRSGDIDLEKHITVLKDEIDLTGAKNIIAIGRATESILRKELDGYDVVYIPHYSMRISKERYKDACLKLLME